MNARWFATALVCGAFVVLGGCAEDHDEKPPTPPTPQALARFTADTRQPGYWLGPDFEGVTVSHVRAAGGLVSLTYGEWSCSPGSGCSDPGGISTRLREPALADIDIAMDAPSADCWSRVGKAIAVLDGCVKDGYPQRLVVYSGRRQIEVTSVYTRDGQSEVSARTALRRLRPLNARAPWPLPPPERLSCGQFRRVDERLRRHMPRPLRPACRP